MRLFEHGNWIAKHRSGRSHNRRQGTGSGSKYRTLDWIRRQEWPGRVGTLRRSLTRRATPVVARICGESILPPTGFTDPKHVVVVRHKWGSPTREPYNRRRPLSVRDCRICGAKQTTLELSDSSANRSIDRFTSNAVSPYEQHRAKDMDGLEDIANRWTDAMEEFTASIIRGSKYSNCGEFAERIESRTQGLVGPQNLTFGAMRYIIRNNGSQGGKRRTRKVLLAFKQGLVCDVCDRVVQSLDDLTEDHIMPQSLGGQSILTNLRLTCLRCNQEKADKLPKESDVSPFVWTGRQCIHWVSCRKFIERSGKADC